MGECQGGHLHGGGAAHRHRDKRVHARVASVHFDFHKASIDDVYYPRYCDAGLRDVCGDNHLANISASPFEHSHLSVVRHRRVNGNGRKRQARAAAGRLVVQQAYHAFDVVLQRHEHGIMHVTSNP